MGARPQGPAGFSHLRGIETNHFDSTVCMLYASVFVVLLCLGGPLAVTDANLILGRLLPEYFPKIFGKTEDQPLDKEATHAAFTALSKEVCSQ